MPPISNLRTYRVYGKLLGYSLPKEGVEISKCHIRQMSFVEQRKRRFTPLNIDVEPLMPKDYYKSYLALGIARDTRIFKTKYVIYTDIDSREARDLSGIVGTATNRFDRVMGALSLGAAVWFSKTHNRDPLYKGYEYQISKVYELKDGEELPFEGKIIRGAGSHINLPAKTVRFDTLDHQFIQHVIKAKDQTFKRALRYLQTGERAMNLGLPLEKVVLDFMKSMEVIVESFKTKKTKIFKQKLVRCARKIGLTQEDQDQVMALWKARSNGDVAHAKQNSWAEYLPAQYPIPSDVQVNTFLSADLPAKIILKYFEYKRGEVRVVLENEDHWDPGTLINVNMGSYYIYKPRQGEKKQIKKILKNHLASLFRVKKSAVRIRSYSGNEFVYKVAGDSLGC